jgi:hypothetical protein
LIAVVAMVGLGVAALAACGGAPFREADRVPLDGLAPEKVREDFAAALPIAFRVVNTVTFRFKGKAFAAIGYTEVDTARGTFSVVGLHPAAGVTLFEVSGDSETAKSSFALEQLSEWGDVARAVGDDTRRMYFDRLPSPDARAFREKYRIRFRERRGDGVLEYVFAGSGGALVEKSYYEHGRRLWSASYYEYRWKNGKLYPDGIVLEHHEYGYRLEVRLKEIRS